MVTKGGYNDEMKEFLGEVQSMSTQGNKDNLMSSDVQLERLLSRKYYNPYDVLLLKSEAADEEIKRAYRGFSVLVHPDKCKDPRAPDAFHILEQAQKTLLDPEKRKVFQRVMREARERVEFERGKENKRRKKAGLPDLPEDTFEAEVRDTCDKLFIEIEERKEHYEQYQCYVRKKETKKRSTHGSLVVVLVMVALLLALDLPHLGHLGIKILAIDLIELLSLGIFRVRINPQRR